MAAADPSLLQRIIKPPPTQNHEPLKASGRAGRNMPAAVTSAVVLIGTLAVVLVFARPYFIALVVALMLVGTWEVAGAFARKGITVTLPPLYLGGAAMVVASAFYGPFWVMGALSLTFGAIVVWRLGSPRAAGPAITDIAVSVFVAVYIPFTASFVGLISQEAGDAWPIAMFVVIVACSDIGGWLAGILFGKHPMAPKLSPKKSWEGFAGSVLLASAAGFAATALFAIPWWWAPIYGVAGAVFGTLGDLLESLIKREVGLKDMSAIVPGHGGLMDRLDSILFAAPVFYFLFALSLGWLQ